MPDREHGHTTDSLSGRVVHVVTRTRQEQATDVGTRTDTVRHPSARARAQPHECSGKLVTKEIGGLGPVDRPPLHNALELPGGPWRDDDIVAPRHYGRRRKLSITCSAGMPSP